MVSGMVCIARLAFLTTFGVTARLTARPGWIALSPLEERQPQQQDEDPEDGERWPFPPGSQKQGKTRTMGLSADGRQLPDRDCGSAKIAAQARLSGGV
jgi:hypothetical protein